MNIAIFIFQKFSLALAFLTYLFLVWRQGRLAGFNKDKILDLAIFALTFALLVFVILSHWGFGFLGIFALSFYFFVYYFCQREGWSILKIGDIFAQAVSLAAFFYPYFPHPLFNLFSLFIYFLIRRVGILKPRTGFVFLGFLSLFAFFLTAVSYWQGHRVVYFDLMVSLVALSLSVLGLRRKEYFESMALLKYTVPSDILDKVKAKLLEKQKNISSQEKNLSEEEKSLASGAERSAEEQDQALNAGEKVKNENLLNFVKENKNNVDLALKKIEEGTYGVCERCGQPIDKARLLVFPEAKLCFNCEPKEENEEVDVTLQ